MMLVYNLNSVSDVYGRYPGVDGSAYVIGGLGMTVIKYGDVVMVADPLRRRGAPRRQCRLPEVHPGTDLEPLLRAQKTAKSPFNAPFIAAAQSSEAARAFLLAHRDRVPSSGKVDGTD